MEEENPSSFCCKFNHEDGGVALIFTTSLFKRL